MSSKFYSSVYRYKGQIFANWFDENGERHITKEKYEPYLFLDNPKGEFKTVFGQSVSRVDFANVWDAADTIKKRKVHGLTNWEYQYIFENFEPGVYDRELLNIGNIDIEVDVEGGYPDIETADKEITLIQLLVNGEMWVFGRKDFNTDNLWKDGILSDATKSVRYLQFETEALLLRKFLRIWEQLELDALTGWNIRQFDIPYIIRRLRRVLGEDSLMRLSPYGVPPQEQRSVNAFGQDKVVYSIPGVADLDYIELYRKLIVPLKGQPESFSLDYISSEVLGVRKLDYSEYGDLANLYKQNPQKYAEYGVRDVDLVERIDHELNLIEIALVLAYDAGVNLQDIFGTVRPWDAIIHRYLMERNIVIPNVDVEETTYRIEGGHVKDPQNGLHRWVVSFDVASLYPHIIMQNNMGAETKIRRPKAPVRSDDFLKPDFDKRSFCDDTTVLAGNGAMFSNKTQSFFSALMEDNFKKRTVYKKKMLEAAQNKEKATTKEEKAKWETIRVRNDNAQHVTKIKINSFYGSLANRYSRWYDPDIAEGITQSGQLAIKWAERAVNQRLNKFLKTEDIDFVIAIDTDSLYISLERVIDELFEDQTDTVKVIEFMDKFCNDVLQPTITKAFDDLAKMTDARENKLNMKREALANKGIWTGKKHYILNVYNNEGVVYNPPKRKMVGIEAVKSSTPNAARRFIGEAIGIILDKEEDDLHEFIAEKRAQYKALPLDEIAFPRGVNGIEKWECESNLYKKGCPIHVSSSINFNTAIAQKGLVEFPKIKSGDKIKFVYLNARNPWRFKSIGFLSILPPALGLDNLVDRNKQFEKGFLQAVKSITDVIGWRTEKRPDIGGFFTEM